MSVARQIAARAVRAAQPRTWRRLWRRWQAPTFLEFYASCVNEDAAVDPVAAVGGRWEEIGRLQFDFLRREGLRPDSTLLDLGCGALRGGRHFIRFLNRGHYYGVDISSTVLAAAERVLSEEGLADQAPSLRLVADTTFDWFGRRTFDFGLAQSVFTHMRPADLERTFAHMPNVMAPHSVFYATCYLGADSLWRRLTATTFAYPLELFSSLAARHGLDLALLPPEQYPHPYGTRMLRITRRAGAAGGGARRCTMEVPDD